MDSIRASLRDRCLFRKSRKSDMKRCRNGCIFLWLREAFQHKAIFSAWQIAITEILKKSTRAKTDRLWIFGGFLVNNPFIFSKNFSNTLFFSSAVENDKLDAMSLEYQNRPPHRHATDQQASQMAALAASNCYYTKSTCTEQTARTMPRKLKSCVLSATRGYTFTISNQ